MRPVLPLINIEIVVVPLLFLHAWLLVIRDGYCHVSGTSPESTLKQWPHECLCVVMENQSVLSGGRFRQLGNRSWEICVLWSQIDAKHSTAFWNYSPCTCFVKHCRGFKLFPAARYSTFLRSIKVAVWWAQICIFKSELQAIIFPELNRFQTGWNWSMNSTELLYTQTPESNSTELGLRKNSEMVYLCLYIHT